MENPPQKPRNINRRILVSIVVVATLTAGLATSYMGYTAATTNNDQQNQGPSTMFPPNGSNSSYVIHGSPPPGGGGGFMIGPGNNTGGPFGQGNGNFNLPGNPNSTYVTGPTMSPQTINTQSSDSNVPIFMISIAAASMIGIGGVFLLTRKRKNPTVSETAPPPNDSSDSEVWQDD